MTSARQAGADAASIADFTAFFKAFCNSTRADIVEQLMSGEKCVCEIVAHVGGSQPLVSHHLAMLRDAGFVTMRGEGTRTYYAIDWAELRLPARRVPRDHAAARELRTTARAAPVAESMEDSCRRGRREAAAAAAPAEKSACCGSGAGGEPRAARRAEQPLLRSAPARIPCGTRRRARAPAAERLPCRRRTTPTGRRPTSSASWRRRRARCRKSLRTSPEPTVSAPGACAGASRRDDYRVRPGLYALGAPGDDSPVLVTANYKLTLDVLRSSLRPADAWLLVVDTAGHQRLVRRRQGDLLGGGGGAHGRRDAAWRRSSATGASSFLSWPPPEWRRTASRSSAASA